MGHAINFKEFIEAFHFLISEIEKGKKEKNQGLLSGIVYSETKIIQFRDLR